MTTTRAKSLDLTAEQVALVAEILAQQRSTLFRFRMEAERAHDHALARHLFERHESISAVLDIFEA